MTATISPVEEWNAWHEQRERDLATPHGWLSLTALHWLPDTPQQLPGLPGRYHFDGDQAVLTAGAADGYSLPEDAELGTRVEGTLRAGVAEAQSLTWVCRGDVIIELIRRGGRYAIRVRDPKAATRRTFRGVPAYPVDERWVRPARFTAWPEPVFFEVATARADLVQRATGVGTVRVDIGGVDYELVAGQTPGGSLLLSFRDTTNGVETAGWRTVNAGIPDADGRLDIDFNRTVNFPYAFTDFGTCPQPVAGNDLPVPVTAGEKAPLR